MLDKNIPLQIIIIVIITYSDNKKPNIADPLKTTK